MSRILNASIFFFLILLFSFSCGFTTTAEELPLSLAKHLFAQANYDAAITEYKRFLFFHPDDPRIGEVYQNIGLAYRAQDLWAEATNSLRMAVHHAADSESKSECQLELAVTLIAMQDYDLAQLALIKATLQAPSALLYRRALFLRGIAYIYQFRWDEAREVLRDWSTDEKLDTLFDEASNVPQKSVNVARLLSTILPGAGQVYADNWTSGLNAFLLNGTLGFLTVDAAFDRHYTDAILWGVLAFWRYYRGNTYRAGAAVEQFNEQQIQKAAGAILQQLQEIADPP